MEGLNLAADVRCPACSKLLAKRQADGSYQVKIRDRSVVTIKAGSVLCVACTVSVPIEPPGSKVDLTWGRHR